jgi:lipopolysaccharide transport system ATP-binding protein
MPDLAVRARGLGKCYQIYRKPRDRLLQALVGKRRQLYRSFWALREVSLTVARGETVGVIGRNGSGKSTLLQLLCGTLSPTAGEVRVQGRLAALLELGAGFNPEFTGRENAYVNAAILGLPPQEMERLMPEIEQFADLGSFIDQPVKTYSSGMYVRLAFAIAASIEPDVLLVDEALAVGDIRFQAKCLTRLRDLRRRNKAVLLVSHDVHTIRDLCDRTVWLDQGQVRMAGDTLRVTAAYMEAMMGHPEHAASAPASKGVDHFPRSQPLASDSPHAPIRRWGSRVGLIQGCELLGASGQSTRSVALGEQLAIRLVFYIPEGIPLETLSAAISIKNAAGTDLIVSTTFDDGYVRFDQHDVTAEVTFELANHLAEGEYILVAAIEDRSSAPPTYYDYIEGADYFASFAPARPFGLFHVPVSQTVVTRRAVCHA